MCDNCNTSAAAGPGSFFALHALDLCLYSEALAAMTTMDELRNQLMALVFRLSWGVQRPIQLAKDYTRHVQDPHSEASSQTSSDDDVSESAVSEAEPAAANGDAAVQQSLSEQVLCSCSCTQLCMMLLVIIFMVTNARA